MKAAPPSAKSCAAARGPSRLGVVATRAGETYSTRVMSNADFWAWCVGELYERGEMGAFAAWGERRISDLQVKIAVYDAGEWRYYSDDELA